MPVAWSGWNREDGIVFVGVRFVMVRVVAIVDASQSREGNIQMWLF